MKTDAKPTKTPANHPATAGATNGASTPRERRPFRAADVLTGTIDKRRGPAPQVRARKQISAQLEPAQLRLLGELHARLNATATARIEKSDLVGLGIELLAAVLESADGELAPASDPNHGAEPGGNGAVPLTDLAALRSYVRTHVRGYDDKR